MGVEIRSSTAIGRDVSLAQLEGDFDAIFLGIGLGATDDLHIPGEEFEGCRDALSFIEETKSKRLADIQLARRIAVVGGGNTAIDVVTAARRLGAEEVYMVYRRGPEEMSAFAYEYELAKRDMVLFWWQALPVRIIGDAQGRVAALECIRTEKGPPEKARGRSGFVPVPGSEFRLDVGMVIKALGQQRKTDLLRQIAGLELKDGCVIVDPVTMRASNPKYYAGGDCVNGGGEVVDAVAHGKKAAAGIHQALEARSGRRSHAGSKH
jgi:glutamate synthase (NADPH/NADH) small chain